jgi:hypothetical protein
MNTKKRLEDYNWDELLELTSGKEGMKEGGRDSGKYTLDNHLGIHTEDEELRREWARMGGEATIEKLLQWQIDNNFRVCDLERTDEWCNNISIAMTGRKIPKSIVNKMKKTLKAKVAAMTVEERSEKYRNDSASRKSLRIRTEILNLIENDTFITSDARRACEQYGLDNWKGFLKDKRIIKQIHKGTNQNNPSIYEKLK